MKIQSKLLGGRFGKRGQTDRANQPASAAAVPGAGAASADGMAGANPAMTMGMGTNLRMLGSELQQSSQLSTFEYSKNRVLVIKSIAALLVMLTIAHAGLVLIPFAAALESPVRALLSWTALGLLLEVAASGLVAAVLVNLFPSLRVTPEGLGVAEVTGWRTIPWNKVGVLRVMEFGGRVAKGRYLVMVPFTGKTTPATPAPMLRWIPALFGVPREGARGVMLSSDIKNFDRLLQLTVSYLMHAQGGSGNMAVESFVDEQVTMSTAQLMLDPDAALERLSRYTIATEAVDPYGVTQADTDPPVSWPRMMLRQLPIALLPAVMFLTTVLVRSGDRPVSAGYLAFAAVLLVLGLVELPFVAYLVQGVGDLMVGGGKFKRAVWAYVELELPRTFALLVGLAFLAIGLPEGFALAMWLGGLAVTTLLTTRFVQKLYYMPFAHTLPAAVGVSIYQLLVLVHYFWVR